MLSDYAAIVAASLTAYFIRAEFLPWVLPGAFPHFHISWTYVYVFLPFAYMLFMHFDRLYSRRLLFWQQAQKLFKASVYAILLILVISYITGAVKEISRSFMVVQWLTSFSYLLIVQYSAKKILSATGLWQIPVILVGAGKTAELLINAFEADYGLGYKVAGIIEDNPNTSLVRKYPLLGTFETAEQAVTRTGIKDVLIAAPGLSREGLLDLVYRLQPYVDKITFVPDLFGVPVGDIELDTLFNEKAVLLCIRNNLANKYNRVLKRSFDMACSIVGTLVLLPLGLIISLMIYIADPGPVIFSHKRIGRDGQSFYCYKFRTMIRNADSVLEEYLNKNPEAQEEWQKDFKLKDDPRVTKIGLFLRRTSLDELPQLINVIQGRMSLVGPRPIVYKETFKYGNYINDYYSVRPGITGIWQVSGRNDIEYIERIKMDSWYVRNWSLWLDITLVVKTVMVVAQRKGAY
jgi:undecaprenyl-phosphate galactose phosphotransferase